VRRWDAAKAIASLHGQAPKVAGVIAAARAREVDPRVQGALRDALAVVAREGPHLNAVLQSSSLGSEETDTARDAVRTAASLGAPGGGPGRGRRGQGSSAHGGGRSGTPLAAPAFRLPSGSRAPPRGPRAHPRRDRRAGSLWSRRVSRASYPPPTARRRAPDEA